MKKLRKLVLLAFINIITILTPSYCITGPTLLLDRASENSKEFTFDMGPILRYKHNESSALNFKGDMAMWGVRLAGGPMEDPKFGLLFCTGEQKNEMVEYNLDMTGVSMEDSIKTDPRVRWRLTAGIGNYKLKSKHSGKVYKDGSFGFLEPMILGLLPLNRNIILEFGVGYTFADATGVRVEGIAVQGELLFGKF